jgi:hypothetical protein
MDLASSTEASVNTLLPSMHIPDLYPLAASWRLAILTYPVSSIADLAKLPEQR